MKANRDDLRRIDTRRDESVVPGTDIGDDHVWIQANATRTRNERTYAERADRRRDRRLSDTEQSGGDAVDSLQLEYANRAKALWIGDNLEPDPVGSDCVQLPSAFYKNLSRRSVYLNERG